MLMRIFAEKKYFRVAAIAAVILICGMIFAASFSRKTVGTETEAAALQLLTTGIPVTVDPQLLQPSAAQTLPAVPESEPAAQSEAVPAADSSASPQPSVPAASVSTYIFPTINDVAYPDLPAFPQMPTIEVSPDTFVFITYGHGHGVGMSQCGAIAFSRHGYDFVNILAHYYPGVSFMVDSAPPEFSSTYTGEVVKTFELVCRVVQNEMGWLAKGDREALKAQAVAVYTQLRKYGYQIPNKHSMAIAADMSKVNADVLAAVTETYGIFMTYNGDTVNATFYTNSAGVTAAGYSIWGVDTPYLRPVTSYYDWDVYTYSGYANLINVKSFTSAEMREHILKYDSKINLGPDPATWLQVLAHDKALSPEIGYMTAIRIGDRILTERDSAGEVFRLKVMNLAIKSPCFSLIYFDSNMTAHNLGAVMG